VQSAEHSEARLIYRALHDALTGLPNRQAMEQHLSDLAARSSSRGTPIGLMFFDLDRFKLINDTLGHRHGDELLVQVARRLAENSRAGDLVSRIGGDEFVVVLGGSVGVSEARASPPVARVPAGAVRIDGSELFVTGVDRDGLRDPGSLVRSEVLIPRRPTTGRPTQAKEAGRDAVAVFDDSMRVHLTERVEIARDLRPRRRAPRAPPRVPGRSCGWATTRCSASRPSSAGRTRRSACSCRSASSRSQRRATFIGEIGSWVLDDALRQLVVCRAIPGFGHLTAAVNLSALQLQDELLVQRVGRALVVHGLEGSALTLELTESEMMSNPELSIASLTALRRLGIQIAVDDFGTKYSSLAYLQRLPINI